MPVDIDVQQFLPSTEDVAFYREHGWWVAPKIISDDLLEEAIMGADRHYAGERDYPLLITGGYLDWRPEHGNVIRLNDYVSLQNEQLRELVHFEVISAIAATLAGTSTIRLFHDQLVTKPAGLEKAESTIGWHVDAAYWKTCSSRNMLTAWIPFQDCDEEMGSLCVIDGSHHRPDTEWMKTFNERDLDALERQFSDGRTLEKVPLRMERGQVSFHHCRTIHGSEANRSDRDRVALAVHVQDESNRYVPHVDDTGRRTVHINDLLVRKDQDGNPDYSDPEICPVLWPRG
ncbi:MAG TPA: phytanoyl-CoA dioxygenase family protein [Solirubrobacteraceae bacterium]|jgi:ectoine hydroxylase-related dioxygenase (phytanoyl-CoA dioxygenase family)|nr:phytanoyl-CoA dioxygenase family protein [Solirubrobacteraceae bacterium]